MVHHLDRGLVYPPGSDVKRWPLPVLKYKLRTQHFRHRRKGEELHPELAAEFHGASTFEVNDDVITHRKTSGESSGSSTSSGSSKKSKSKSKSMSKKKGSSSSSSSASSKAGSKAGSKTGSKAGSKTGSKSDSKAGPM